jgi:hypothetical protein
MYARKLIFYTSVKWLGLNKREEFEFKIETSKHLEYKPDKLGFHSSFQIT